MEQAKETPARRLSGFGRFMAFMTPWLVGCSILAAFQGKALWVVLAVAGCAALSGVTAWADWRGHLD